MLVYYMADHRENSLNPTTTIVAIEIGNKDIQGKMQNAPAVAQLMVYIYSSLCIR
jgi:hypothetical protein